LALKLLVVDRLVGIQRFYEIEPFPSRVLSGEAQKIDNRVRIDHDQLLLADIRFHGRQILSQSATVRRGYDLALTVFGLLLVALFGLAAAVTKAVV
jgi:hypothetical protein